MEQVFVLYFIFEFTCLSKLKFEEKNNTIHPSNISPVFQKIDALSEASFAVEKLLLFIFINPLNAMADTETIQVYRWTDNSGIIHISQFPPEGKNYKFKVEKIQVSIPVLEPPKEQNNNGEV